MKRILNYRDFKISPQIIMKYIFKTNLVSKLTNEKIETELIKELEISICREARGGLNKEDYEKRIICGIFGISENFLSGIVTYNCPEHGEEHIITF
jgi:hypothetical protein